MLESATKTMKELKGLIASVIAVAAIMGLNPEQVKEYIVFYNLHIILYSSFTAYIGYYIINKKHELFATNFNAEFTKVIGKHQEQLSEVLLDNARNSLRGRIKQAYKDYEHVDKITTRNSIEYLRDLERQRVELQLNSFSEDTMRILLGKIVVSRG